MNLFIPQGNLELTAGVFLRYGRKSEDPRDMVELNTLRVTLFGGHSYPEQLTIETVAAL